MTKIREYSILYVFLKFGTLNLCRFQLPEFPREHNIQISYLDSGCLGWRSGEIAKSSEKETSLVFLKANKMHCLL